MKEILTCYEAHGIPFPPGVSEADADEVTKLAGWMWGVLYQDDELNRYAIGRFLRELLDVLDVSVLHKEPSISVQSSSESDSDTTDTIDTSCRSPAKMMLFSGHDSTLVPVLCALGIYDNTWPPYASYLAIEIAESNVDPTQLFVRAIYNDKEMIIEGCTTIW